MIKKILIANRGEIALRVIRACKELNIKTVAVYSEVDRNSLHVIYSDEAYLIGPAPSNESYLLIDKIIDVAKKSKADAIHPGYGFLSENAEFSDRCKKEGIIFIGPDAKVISTMGDKITARQTMIKSGVAVVPGNQLNIESEKEAKKILKEIGLPVMIKASAGGGGKGMRLVKEEKEFIPSLEGARSEAKAAFGNDAVYIEKYIESPHHIEFQILGDKFGNVIHLFERECSIQRRHQKVVEETPSPLLTPAVRKKMGDTAVAAAKAVNYVGAGTIEFLTDENLNFYFLEMNTRLQVEHAITEQVTGVDLVKEQIKIASGEKLSFSQKDISQTGHAIEVRIYAEDYENNFMPSPGKIIHNVEPTGKGVRVDSFVHNNIEISSFYDPMIAKLVTWDDTRTSAINKMKRALSEYTIIGVKTSIDFLYKIMEHKLFIAGKYNTHFIEDNLDGILKKQPNKKLEEIAAITAFIDYLEKNKITKKQERKENPWTNYYRKKSINFRS